MLVQPKPLEKINKRPRDDRPSKHDFRCSGINRLNFPPYTDASLNFRSLTDSQQNKFCRTRHHLTANTNYRNL